MAYCLIPEAVSIHFPVAFDAVKLVKLSDLTK